MAFSERHAKEMQRILEAAVTGIPLPTVDSLRSEFGVSQATAYNDVELLTRMRISKSRGSLEVSFDAGTSGIEPERFSVRTDIKRMIADEVVTNHIPVGSIIYLDTGSTCFYVAKALVEHGRADLGIITANPFAVAVLAAADFGGEVVVLGGTLRRQGASMHGRLTEQALSSVRFDVALISVDFVHDNEKGTVATFSPAEVEQKRLAVARASSNVIVIADDSKLGRNLGNEIFDLRNPSPSKSATVIVGTDDSEPRTAKYVKSLRTVLGERNVVVVRPD